MTEGEQDRKAFDLGIGVRDYRLDRFRNHLGLHMIVWALTTSRPNRGDRLESQRTVVICSGRDREEAKREARQILGGDPDYYICTPITRLSDNVVIKFKMEGKVTEHAAQPVGG